MGEDPFAINIRPMAKAELNELRAFDQRRITEAIRSNLAHDPFTATRNRKPVPGVAPGFEYNPPLWELRVAEFPVFFDGNEDTRVINVRAVRRKAAGKTTEEITR